MRCIILRIMSYAALSEAVLAKNSRCANSFEHDCNSPRSGHPALHPALSVSLTVRNCHEDRTKGKGQNGEARGEKEKGDKSSQRLQIVARHRLRLHARIIRIIIIIIIETGIKYGGGRDLRL